MSAEPLSQLFLKQADRWIALSCAMVIVLSLFALASVTSGAAPMSPFSAFGFVLLATSLLALHPAGRTPAWTRLGTVCLSVPFLMSTLFLAKHFFGAARPGAWDQMPAASAGLAFLAVAIWASHLRAQPLPRFSQLLSVLAFFVGLQSLACYVLQLHQGSVVAFSLQVSLLSSVLFVAMSSLVILSRAELGWASIFFAQDVSGRLARKLTLSVIVIPWSAAWLAQEGVRYGYYDGDFEGILRLMGSIGLFLAVIWKNVKEIRFADRKLQSAHKRMLEQRLYFETVFRSLPDAAFVSNRERNIALMNPAAEGVFGGRREIYLSQSAAKIYEHPEDFETLGAQIFNPNSRRVGPLTLEVRFKRANGSCFDGEMTASVLRDPDGEVIGYVGIIRDITQRNRQRAELQNTVARLEEEQGLRERFVASLTHDLRNPLSTANALVQLSALRYSKSNESLGQILLKVRTSLDRVDRMMRNLLDASRIRAGQTIPLRCESCNLRRILQQAVEGVKAIYGERFVVDAQEDIMGHWDPDALLRVLENLIVNAVKYGRPRAPIVLRSSHRDGIATFSVRNEGKAITAEDQAALFEPYMRAVSAESSGKRGWGIGLSLVRAITEAHGGSVQVQSLDDQGTTFTITLPCARAEAQLA